MPVAVKLNHIAIVLHRPRFPENIGAAARAAKNMGIEQLVVVQPEDFDPKRVRMMATKGAADVVDGITIADSLQDALTAFTYVIGTTARLGGQRQVIGSPEKLAQELIPLLPHNRIALLFGPEDKGLTNDDLRLCHKLVNIPTAQFASLNLAQAVLIVSYALFQASRPPTQEFAPRLAARHELDGMYAQLKDILVRINFLLPDNPDYWMNRLRHFLTRLQLRAKEVAIIRGIYRQINWYAGKCYQDGYEDGRQGRASNPPRPNPAEPD